MKALRGLIGAALAVTTWGCSTGGGEDGTTASGAPSWEMSTMATDTTSDAVRLPIPEDAIPVVAERSSEVAIPVGGEPAPVIRLIQTAGAWEEFTQLYGDILQAPVNFNEHSLVALRVGLIADAEQLRPELFYLANGIHVVFPGETGRGVASKDGDQYVVYRVPREFGGRWPTVKTIRFSG